MKNFVKAFLYLLPVIVVATLVVNFTISDTTLLKILTVELYVGIAILFAIILVFALIVLTTYIKNALYYSLKIDIRLKKKPE